jgi:two-component system, LuxR family, sensor kinase FixL
MELLSFAYLITLVIVIVVSLMIAVQALRFWAFPSAKSFFVICVLICEIAFSFLMLSLSRSPEHAWFWARMRFVGLVFVNTMIFWFIQEITGNRPPRLHFLFPALLIIPCFTLSVVWSDQSIPLFFSEWGITNFDLLTVEQSRYGEVFRIHAIYNNLLLVFCYIQLVRQIFRPASIIRNQAFWILSGTLFGNAFALVQTLHGNFLPLNTTPIGLAIGISMYAWAVFRQHLFDILPMAYSLIFTNLKASVIVLNTNYEIIRLNPSADRLFKDEQAKLHTFVASIRDKIPTGTPESYFETVISRQTFDVHVSTLFSTRGKTLGMAIVLHEISERKHLEESLRQQNEFLAALHHITLDLLQKRDLTDILQLIVDHATNIMDAPYAELLIKEGDDLVVRAYTENMPFLKGDRVTRHDPRLSWKAHDTLNSVVIENYSSLQTSNPIYHDLKLHAVGVFPIVIHQECHGVLEVARAEAGRHFCSDDIQRALHFSQLAALVLENARLYDTAIHELNERKRTENALRESNQRYNTLVENLPAMVYRFRRTPQGQVSFDYVSPRSREMNGLEPDEIINKPHLFISHIHPDDLPGLIALEGESAHMLNRFVWEGRCLVRGEERWLHLESQPARLEDGTILWDGIQIDLTQQKKTEIALQRSQRLIERITLAIPDLVYVFDMVEGRNIYVNRELGTVLGYSPEEIQTMGNMLLSKIMHPDDLSRQQNEVKRFFTANDGDIIESEYRFRHRNGEYRCLYIRDTLYEHNADGSPRQILGIAQDITERKMFENQRAQLLTMLESVNKDLRDFAYIISHDLKAPLRGVSSIATWLVTDYGDKFDEEGQKLIHLMMGRVRRMEEMINGVLEYSRIGRDSEIRIEIDLNEMVSKLIEDLPHRNDIQVIIEGTLPIMDIEPTRIRQVFQNLIDNAVKFMDKTSGVVRIGCRQQSTEWIFWIQDNGPGIAPQYFERIFQIFQTLTPRDQFESTGVGLAIVKRIIDLYKGRVWVESTVGIGSTFYFALPEAT